MIRLTMAVAVLVAPFSVTSASSQSLSPAAAKGFAEYQLYSPQAAFVVATNGTSHWQAGVSGPDPASAVTRALSRCSATAPCTVYAVNNILLNGRDWKSAAPAASPMIGRLRGQPWWSNKGPQAAAGLIVWSHGYLAGADSTNNAPQPYVGRFLAAGYDLYRFDREWIHDQPGDAADFAAAVRQAKAMGYRRVILAGQSNGAWQSLAAVQHGAPADGVISMAPALNDVLRKVRDLSVLRSDWQQLVREIKTNARIVVANFQDDDHDVGGRIDDARVAFAAAGVQAMLFAEPAGFKGHDAANDFSFARKFGACIQTFVETGRHQEPCP